MAFHSLSIGSSALLTARYGLDVVGQNLGNVDTAGYSRQRLNQAGTVNGTGGLSNAIMGNGVWVSSVKRIANEYMEKQLRNATTTDEYYGTKQIGYSNIKSFFNELSGNALSDSMNNFWDAMNDFSSQVENLAVRNTTVSEAEQLTGRFNSLGQQLDDYQRDVNSEVEESVLQINRLAQNIAQLNHSIVTSELGGQENRSANDLRDQRGEALKELAKYMDVDVLEEKNGSFTVSLHGRTLVYFDQAKEIINDKVKNERGLTVNMPAFETDRYPLNPKDGILAAQMELRDSIIPSYQDELNNLASNFIWEFNRAYSQTRGLENFTSLKAKNGPTNPQDTLDKLSYPNSNYPAGTFQIVNGAFEIVVHNKNTNQATTLNIEIDLDGRPSPAGEPDTILWDPDHPGASNSLINRMQKALDSAVPGAFEVTIDRQNQVAISAKSSDYSFAFGEDTSGVLAALGLNVFFTGHNAADMAVNQELKQNPSLMGSAKSFNKGDNSGALALLGLQTETYDNLKGMTFAAYYQSSVGRLASETSCTNNNKDLAIDIKSRMFNQRESMCGVSEEEEVTKLITYQRAFQSAAKFISTVDQLYETLINM